MKFEDLKGKVIVSIEGAYKDSEKIIFRENNGRVFELYHDQNCCESVLVEDVCGDIEDLLNTPILIAEEIESSENPEDIVKKYQDSFTWTFYKLSTIKGSVTIRWYGQSNGYYSERVDFREIK